MSKITEKQLENLQKKIATIQELQRQIGSIEGQKHIMLHQLVGAQDELQKMQATLEEEYGKVSINIQDGSYEPVTEE
jgi:hypothetical protein